MQSEWRIDMAFLKGALETFAHVNEKQGYGFQFFVDEVEGSDLEALLRQLYGNDAEATRLDSPESQLTNAIDAWLFRYILGPGPKLNDEAAAFHFSDRIARQATSRAFANLLINSLEPESVYEVTATDEGEDEDESERMEFALVTGTHIVLVHLGVCEY